MYPDSHILVPVLRLHGKLFHHIINPLSTITRNLHPSHFSYHSTTPKYAHHNSLQTPLSSHYRPSFSVYGFCYRTVFLYSAKSTKRASSSYRKRVNRRLRIANEPVLDEAQFKKAISQLAPRFTADDLHDIIVLEADPLVCLELFNWATSQHSRFRHNLNSYHVTIQKLGAAQMYDKMDDVVNQVLAVPHICSEPLYNTMIYYYTEASKLTRAVDIFKHMKDGRNLRCKPTIRTYNLLFAALLGRRSDTYVNYMYMEAMRGLFKQLVRDGIEPDVFALNCMIKGYVQSNHVNDALVILHQMGTVYKTLPNAMSYDCIVHGLCAQGRTRNAREICDEMKVKGFVLSGRTHNSVVNALALNGEVEDALCFLWEMVGEQKSVDFITYKTVLDQICRHGKEGEALCFLQELKERKVVDAFNYKKLLSVLGDDFAYGN